jgi:hypothetical protein
MVFPHLAMLKYYFLCADLRPSSFDPRVVLLVVLDHQADWETGARGGDDYWIAAEQLVEKQCAGDFYGTFPHSRLSTLTDHFSLSDFVPGDFSKDEWEVMESELSCQIA